MAKYIETQTQDGSTIRIEVKDTSKPTPGFTTKAASNNVSGDETKDAYRQTLQIIQSCANDIIETIQKLHTPPSSASADFAVRIDAEAGAMVATSKDDAQFRISLSWKQAEPDDETA